MLGYFSHCRDKILIPKVKGEKAYFLEVSVNSQQTMRQGYTEEKHSGRQKATEQQAARNILGGATYT